MALKAEASARRKETAPPATLYIGGGTPTLYPAADLACLVSLITALQPKGQPLEEITVEANPSDITTEYCRTLRRAGVTRLSLGIQSFNDELLGFMGRRHRSTQALEAYHAAAAVFDNLSIDLIFGFPHLTQQVWEQTLSAAVALKPAHISAYQLSLEGDCVWGKLLAEGKLALPAEEDSAAQYTLLQQMLTGAGYLQYEISNFCLPGFESRHNSAYWQRVPYTGLGPGAHSFNGTDRFWNVCNVKRYIEEIRDKGIPPRRYDRLNPTEAASEQVMLSLRTTQGLDTALYRNLWGARRTDRLLRAAAPLVQEGRLRVQGNYLKINPPQYFVADSLIRELF